jgi:hypothetical protein
MKRLATLLLLLLLVAAPALQAGPYDRVLCPMINGQFILVAGQLWIEITKQDGKPVEKRREQIANPLDKRSHEVLSKRGPVVVETHPTRAAFVRSLGNVAGRRVAQPVRSYMQRLQI